MLRSFFEVAQQVAKNELICYANCDLVLPRDFLCAVNVVDAIHGRVSDGGPAVELDVDAPIEFQERAWETELTKRQRKRRGRAAGTGLTIMCFAKDSI